jgi:predicted transcriptional regulator
MAGKTKSEKRARSAKPTAKRSRRKAETGDAELISALNHVLRREILRLMHSSPDARSPVDISEELGQPLAGVSYHVQILHRLGTITMVDTVQVRGALKHFYASTVEDHEIAQSLLESTERADRSRSRGAK